jgi:hypothetical protein
MTTNAAKAQLWKLDASGQPAEKFEVQFNPESLKVTFANQMQPKEQGASDNSRGTSSTQYVGKGSTKLAVTLWFDVNAEMPTPIPEGDPRRSDVRKLTEKVIDLIKTQPVTVARDQPIPPAVRFLWGTFQFDGLVESIEQSLDFFSPDGVPLRASIGLNMSQQSIDYGFVPPRPGGGARPPAARLPGGAPPGTSPLTSAPSGATLQGLAAAVGKAGSWPAIAIANGIENPRLLAPGQLVDLNVAASPLHVGATSGPGGLSGEVGLSGQVGASGQLGLSGQVGLSG